MTKSCTRPHRAPVGATASRSAAAAMTRTRSRGRGMGLRRGTGLAAHAPTEPIFWRRLRGRGAPWITCCAGSWQGSFREGWDSPSPRGGAWSRGCGAGREGRFWACSRGLLSASNSWPCYPGNRRRGGHLAGWGRGAVRTLGETNEKTRPCPRGRCRRSHAHLRRAVAARTPRVGG